jgi:hypothetical protein
LGIQDETLTPLCSAFHPGCPIVRCKTHVGDGDSLSRITKILEHVLNQDGAAERSVLIKNMLEDLGDSGEAIPIPNVGFTPNY